jgi:hypothetical protein
MLGPGRPVLRFPKSQVYFCSGIVAMRETSDDVDWAILRLDREVPDHPPLPIRRTGKVPNSQSLVLVGHPMGLPAKVAAGARVRENDEPGFFRSNLDAYVGNSGSPVLDAESLVVEGLLVSGELDFVENGDCLVTNRCQDAGCVGEAVTRATEFDHAIPVSSASVTYEVQLGRCGSLTLLGETSGTSMEVGPLDPATTYCWQVSAKSGCGKTVGPIWSFTTGAGARTFRRGDATGDGSRDITDAIIVLTHLYLGGEAPACEKSADSDDNGALDLSDPIYLLIHLFQGGLPPAAPYESCGPDPTPDAIPCAAPGPCL